MKTTQAAASMTAKEFRAELVKIMPGYAWTVHNTTWSSDLSATGIQSSGFNRLSTLKVTRSNKDGVAEYTARSAGYGLRAKFLHSHTDWTLARALRGLQSHYEAMAATYRSHANSLALGRKSETDAGGAA